MNGWLAPFPDAAAADAEVPVFLPGWGFDGDVLRLLSPLPPWLRPQGMLDPATFFADMEEVLRHAAGRRLHLIGWSMGAVLALALAEKCPEHVARLSLAGLRRHWPQEELALARRELARDPAAFVRRFHRLALAGDRAAAEFFREKIQQATLARLEPGALARGLDLLARPLPQPPAGVPVTLIHGGRDLVAPVAEMAFIAGAKVEILPEAGHFPLTDPACLLHQQLKKNELSRLFSRAAATYEDHALAQKKAGDLLLDALPPGSSSWPKRVLEIGCGSGGLSTRLATRFPTAGILALDAAPAMAELARQRLAGQPHVTVLAAEAEEFLRRTPEAGFDLIVSSSALQWLPDPAPFFAQAARTLSPEGRLACAVFGPSSLGELSQGLAAVFGQQTPLPVADFATAVQLGSRLRQYFPRAGVEAVAFTMEYASARALLAAIRFTGTGGGRRRRPLVFNRKRLAALEKWFADRGGCRVSYEVILLAGEKKKEA